MDSKSLTKTSFCDKEIDNVTNNELKKHILDDMCQKTNITYKTRYARMFNQQYLKNFNNPHILCLKTIGSPYLLYCTQINDVNYCFLIDKNFSYDAVFPVVRSNNKLSIAVINSCCVVIRFAPVIAINFAISGVLAS